MYLYLIRSASDDSSLFVVVWGFHVQTAGIVKPAGPSLLSYSNVLFFAKCIGFQFKAMDKKKKSHAGLIEGLRDHQEKNKPRQPSASPHFKHTNTQLSNCGLVYVFKTRLVGPVKPEFCRRCSAEGTFVFCALRGRGGRECSSLAQITTVA